MLFVWDPTFFFFSNKLFFSYSAQDFISMSFNTSKYGHQRVRLDVPQAKSVICGEKNTRKLLFIHNLDKRPAY